VKKFEVFDNYLFVVVKELHYQFGAATLLQTSILIFSNLVLTFHSSNVACVAKVFYWIQQNKEKGGFMKSGDWILYALLDAIVSPFIEHVDRMVLETESLDQLVLILSANEENDLLKRIGNARRLMTALRSQLWNKKDMLISLTSKQYTFITEDIKVYFRDVMDHCVSMEQRLDISKEILNSVHNTYLARISLEVTKASNNVNFVMKKFSAVATVFIPLSVITGLFGMNVKVPGQGIDNHYWFVGITSTLTVVAVICLFLFQRLGWF